MSEMLANQYLIAGRYRAAATILERILPSHPEPRAIHRKLVLCHEELGHLDTAIEHATRAVAARPAPAGAPPWRDLEPVQVAARLARVVGQDTQAWNRRALLHLWDDVDRALDCLRRSLALDGTQVPIRRLAATLRRSPRDPGPTAGVTGAGAPGTE